MDIIQQIDSQLSKMHDQQIHDCEEREWDLHRGRPYIAAMSQDQIDERAEAMNVLRACRAEILRLLDEIPTNPGDE